MTSRLPPFAFLEMVSPYNKKNITRWLEDSEQHKDATEARKVLVI